MYICARAKTITTSNILSGWRAAGLVPLSPVIVIEKLASKPALDALLPRTPPEQPNLDLLLLNSSPPDGTELRKANALLNLALKSTEDIPFPVKRYTEQMTCAFEMMHSKLITMCKQVKEQEKLLSTRKAQTKGKRVALKRRFMFSTKEVLEIAKVVEADSSSKKLCGQPHKHPVEEVLKDEEDKVLGKLSSDSNSDCIVVAVRE